jgi:putative membrane protein
MTHPANAPESSNFPTADRRPFPMIRAGVAGVLMGLANLVPGISGGTMILVMGLYDEFVTAVADAVRLRISRRSAALLMLIIATAGVSIAALAGTLSRAVTLHQSAMYSLFIGLTLGGVPALWRMLREQEHEQGGSALDPGEQPASRWNSKVVVPVVGVLLGLAAMIVIALTREAPPDRAEIREAVASGQFVVRPAYSLDFSAGVLGMSAMILPGISGAYMLLILNRYEPILASIALAKRYAFSMGKEGDATVFLSVLIPAVIGAVAGLVVLSNSLKWLLRRHRRLTLSVLLGILLGSVVGIWPFDTVSTHQDYVVGTMLAAVGFAFTVTLSRVTS